MGQVKSYYNELVKEAQNIEKQCSDEHLTNTVKTTRDQDMNEHWDVKGEFKGKTFKVDIKNMKKFNRKDPEVQDDMACIEYVNVLGNLGWIQGQADYIVFKRKKYSWLVVNREELWNFLKKKLEDRNYSKTEKQWFEPKEPYATYDRSFFGKKDKFCWVPFEDIEKLKDKYELK